MKNRSNDLAARFCNYLGRNNLFSFFLDYLTFQFMNYAYEFNRKPAREIKAKKSSVIDKYILKIKLPAWLTGSQHHGDVPDIGAQTPFQNHTDTAGHNCNKALYRGMHGTPCSFAGGTDKTCPKSAVVGWFWSYNIKGLGEIYYIDCCGGTVSPRSVFCNWKNEQNWCSGSNMPSGHYNCTISLTKKELEDRIQITPGTYKWTLKP